MTIKDYTQDIIHKPASGDYERLDEFLNDLLASPTFEEIKFADNTGIKDDSGNEQLIFQKTASAVNHVEVTNAATGNSPRITAAGSDTDIGLEFTTKGNDFIRFNADPVAANVGVIYDLGANDYVNMLIVNSSPGEGGPILNIQQDSASPAAGDFPGGLNFVGNNSVGSPRAYSSFYGQVINTTDGSETGSLDIWAKVAGADTPVMRASNGVIVGTPTGSFKGTGTANFAGDIYKNDTAFTNPDYVLEHHYTGKIERFAENEGAKNYGGRLSIDELACHMRLNLRLPGISNEPMGMFERGDKALEKIEELSLYIVELHQRIKNLEARTP